MKSNKDYDLLFKTVKTYIDNSNILNLHFNINEVIDTSIKNSLYLKSLYQCNDIQAISQAYKNVSFNRILAYDLVKELGDYLQLVKFSMLKQNYPFAVDYNGIDFCFAIHKEDFINKTSLLDNLDRFCFLLTVDKKILETINTPKNNKIYLKEKSKLLSKSMWLIASMERLK